MPPRMFLSRRIADFFVKSENTLEKQDGDGNEYEDWHDSLRDTNAKFAAAAGCSSHQTVWLAARGSPLTSGWARHRTASPLPAPVSFGATSTSWAPRLRRTEMQPRVRAAPRRGRGRRTR